MNTEKPRKRLVGRREYVETMGAKGVTSVVAVLFGCAGAGLLIFGLNVGDTLGAIIGMMGSLGIGIGVFCFKEVKQIAPVALLTKASAEQIAESEAETLVRSSESPATDPQTELLRAAGQGLETPPEQLLRTSQERRE